MFQSTGSVPIKITESLNSRPQAATIDLILNGKRSRLSTQSANALSFIHDNFVLLTFRERTDICNVQSGRGCKVTPPSNSAIRRDRNRISVSTPMLSRARITMVLSVTLPNETGSHKSKMSAEIM